MANDDSWVQDVRRWYFGGHPPEGEVAAGDSPGDEHAVGYEAAKPPTSRRYEPETLASARV